MKAPKGFLPSAGREAAVTETLIETLYGQWTGYTPGIERQAIDAWMTDPGNRQRLFFAQVSGAIACVDGYCSYIGVRPALVVENATANITGNLTEG